MRALLKQFLNHLYDLSNSLAGDFERPVSQLSSEGPPSLQTSVPSDPPGPPQVKAFDSDGTEGAQVAVLLYSGPSSWGTYKKCTEDGA